MGFEIVYYVFAVIFAILTIAAIVLTISDPTPLYIGGCLFGMVVTGLAFYLGKFEKERQNLRPY